jgi:CRISPR-associated protein Cmr3
MFSHLIIIQPLGFLYGSAGPFLSPENLVGRSGNSFPPSAATLSGLYAAKYSEPGTNKKGESTQVLNRPNLILAGPFWAKNNDLENFYVPTPFNYLVNLDPPRKYHPIRQGKISEILVWQEKEQQWIPQKNKDSPPAGKYEKNTWIPIQDWGNPHTVSESPWQYHPHLHPRLETEQRRVNEDEERGSLFLENAVQIHADTCLVYLTNEPLENGWYRFGGEGHLVEVNCQEITNSKVLELLHQPVTKNFALITPAIWGSNRFSYRFPMIQEGEDWQEATEWKQAQIFTERPQTFRYRLGGTNQVKRLARGRYAVPAGTVYILKENLTKSWFEWDENWFPQEGYSYKRWGCGLALPLHGE